MRSNIWSDFYLLSNLGIKIFKANFNIEFWTHFICFLSLNYSIRRGDVFFFPKSHITEHLWHLNCKNRCVDSFQDLMEDIKAVYRVQ
jgi:hypothetical protein